MSLPATPTTYASIRFRSRLEARWAAFFDAAGWRWDYEPDGFPGWIPDFVLKGAANDVYVEVKPITWAQSVGAEQVLQHRDVRKVLDQRNEGFDPEALKTELLVLGDGPQRVGLDWVLGAFVDESWGVAPDWAVICEGEHPPALDFVSERGAFAYRMGGQWDGNKHVRPVNDNLALQAWRIAGNAVQWKGEDGLQPIGPFFQEVARNARRKKEEK